MVCFCKAQFREGKVEYVPKLHRLKLLLTVYQFVEPQRKVADLIVPRGIENRVALSKYLFLAHVLDEF